MMESCSDMLRSAPIYNLCYIKVLNEVPGKSVNFHSNHSKKKKRESHALLHKWSVIIILFSNSQTQKFSTITTWAAYRFDETKICIFIYLYFVFTIYIYS